MFGLDSEYPVLYNMLYVLYIYILDYSTTKNIQMYLGMLE